MPPTDDRRPFDEGEFGGYLENNRDWSDRNSEAVDWLIDNHEAIRKLVGWMPMSTAPTNGQRVILAIPVATGFVHNVEGAFMNGRWMNALNAEVEPLCWRGKVLIPAKFLPWTEEYKACHP